MLLLVIGFSAMAQQRRTSLEPKWTSIISTSPEAFQTQLISSTENSIKVNVTVPGFYTKTVTTPRGEAYVITVPKSVSTAHAGEPDVPMTGIPIMIGDKARMNVRVIDAQYRDFENIEVAPSKGDFPRSIDPATVPYTYGECYSQDAFFPANNVGLYEPYIIRDLRGQNIVIYPFAYNPVTKTLRVYYNMTVEMYKVDDHGANVIATRRSNTVKLDPDFKSLYQRHFINYEASMDRYTPVDEEGDLLIICYDNFISSMTDFVNWKKTRGVNTTIVGTSTAGSSYSAIQTYIRNQYNANNNLTHVLLVGDVAQIPGYSYTGGGSSYGGLGDNAYGQIVGSDYYNDVFIGRFSAQNAAQVTTQVNRVITYERDLTTSDTWLQNADGIAKKEGGSGHNSEDDYQHMDVIRTDLLNYGYNTVYQDYENLSGYTGTASSISSHINSGVGVVNYCNHGNNQLWGVASYSNTQVNQLTNSNKLPFIWSVACLVGKYDNTSTSYGSNYTIGQNNDCFAEAWMHATYSSSDLTPTGAVGALMSYISQPWIPPMWAQDECVDILAGLSSSGGTKHTWGGVSINGLFGIFDNYGTDQSAVGTYQAWILYGDPSMMLRTKTPQTMTVTHNGSFVLGSSNYTVNVSNGNGAVATITDANHNILGKATVSNGTANISVSGNLTAGTELTLCVFGFNKVTYLGTISVVGGTQYNITVNQPQHGTIIVPAQAYANGTVTLAATPETGYCLSAWDVKDASNHSITVTNNMFIMPESDVTVTATFVQGLQVTLASVTNGSISADPLYALQGTTINLTATPATGYEFGSWVVYKTGDPNTTVTVTGNSFTMPNYPVTVSANFTLGPVEVTIGSGTTNNTFLPSYNYYNYSFSQQIYTPEEIGSAGTIRSISFKNTGEEKTRTYSVYLKQTDKETFTGTSDWVSVNSSNLVFTGSLTFTAGAWTKINFTTPFEYDGESNLIVTVADNTGSYTSSPHMACLVFNATNQAIYAYSDGSAYNISSPGTATSVASVKNQIKMDIVLAGGTSCAKPKNLAASDLTATSATLSWTAVGTATDWVLQYGTNSNFTSGTYTEVNVNGTPSKSLTGLTSETTYFARVKTVCGANDESSWSASCTFTPSNNITTCEDFESYTGTAYNTAGVLPTGWNVIFSGSNSAYSPHVATGIYGNYVISSGNGLCFTSGSSNYGTDNYAILPTYEGTLESISFDYRYENASNGTLYLGYITNISNANTFVSLQTVPASTTQGSSVTYSLTGSNIPDNARLAFKWTYSSSYWTCGIDNVCVTTQMPLPPCDAVTAIAVATACESYDWNGETYTESGDYVQTFTNVNGCDSVVTLHLTVITPDATVFSEAACESYDWNGETYTESGDYVQTFTNVNGCDSVVTLHLTVNTPDATEFSVTACESYEWNGETYTESGNYVQTLTNVNGCDSVVTLHLTVNHGTHNAETETAHESYEWHGETYTESGTYTFEYENNEGCESTDTLHLTVTHCALISLPYSENFDTYTQSVTASTGVEPTCWVLEQEDVTMPDNKKPQIYYKSSFAHSGSYSLMLNYRGIYAMPMLSEDVTVQNVKLEMYLRQANAAYQLQVGVWDDELGTFSPVALFNNETTGVELVTCDFSGYTGNGRRIAFRNVLGGGANYNYSYNYLDDITLTLMVAEDCAITLPYNETFEGYTAETGATGVEPDCWNLVQEDVAMTDATAPQLFQKTTYAHSGSYSLRMYNRGIYAMPALSSEVNLNDVKLEMYVRQPNKCYQLQIGVWDEQTETFEPVALVNNSTTDITYFTCDFSGYEGNGRRIAFRNTLNGGANYNYSYNYIDDIALSVIEPSTNCDGRISTLPYEENFDSYTLVTTASTGVEPDCWDLVREDVELTDATRPQLYCKSSFAHSGNYSLKMSYRCVYAMPALPANVNLNDLNLSMYLRQANAAYRLEVGVWDDQTQTFEAVQLLNNSTTNVEPVSCDFSGYTGNGRRIAFRNVLADGAHYNYSYNYLDDITLSYTENARNTANENNLNSTGIGRLLESVSVYPNPTKDYVNVQCTMNNVHCSGIEVIDMYGKVIYTVVGANNYSPLQTRINVSGLAAGMYFVRVTTDQGVVTKTFVKR